MEDCALTGTIPTELGLLTNLIALDLDRNAFIGNLPTELGSLTALTRLQVLENNLRGSSIPTEIGMLTELLSLDVQGNGMIGRIPTELGQCTSLVYLYLEQNKLQGSLPTELGQLTNLQRLFVYENQLSGTIPTEFETLVLLESLFLEGNNFVGSVDEVFCEGRVVLYEFWADCLGSNPKITCTCCTHCCDAVVCEEMEVLPPPESLPPGEVVDNTPEFFAVVERIGSLVTTDLNIFRENPKTPQYQAMTWLANLDPWFNQTSIGDDTPTRLVLERYALAVLYFETKGPTLWTTQFSFLGNSSVCAWQTAASQGSTKGVSCDDEGLFVTGIDFGT
jgi:hypothetical protein